MKTAHIVIISMLVVASAQAAEWSVTPRVVTREEYADNPRLLYADAVAVTGSVTDFAFDFSRRTERINLALTPSISTHEYSGDDTLDETDKYLHLSLDANGERQSWFLIGNWARDSTLTSELGTTGFTQVNKRRDDVELTLGSKTSVTERLDVNVSASGTDTRYHDANRTGLFDYRYWSSAVSGNYALAERLQVAVSMSVGRLTVPQLSAAEMTQLSETAQLAYSWSPRWKSTFTLGPSRVIGHDATDNGAVFGASLEHVAELSSLSISATRETKPTGRGVLVRQDALNLSDRFLLSERLSADVNLNVLRSRDAVQSLRYTRETVEYRRADVGLSWDWTEHVRTRAALGYNTQHSDLADDTAEGMRVSLSLNWTPLPYVF